MLRISSLVRRWPCPQRQRYPPCHQWPPCLPLVPASQIYLSQISDRSGTIRKIQYRHVIPAPVIVTSATASVYKHTWITCQKNYAIHINGPRSLWMKTTLSCAVIHASMPSKLGGKQLCGRVNIMHWLSTCSVQELDVGNVQAHICNL